MGDLEVAWDASVFHVYNFFKIIYDLKSSNLSYSIE